MDKLIYAILLGGFLGFSLAIILIVITEIIKWREDKK